METETSIFRPDVDHSVDSLRDTPYTSRHENALWKTNRIADVAGNGRPVYLLCRAATAPLWTPIIFMRLDMFSPSR